MKFPVDRDRSRSPICGREARVKSSYRSPASSSRDQPELGYLNVDCGSSRQSKDSLSVLCDAFSNILGDINDRISFPSTGMRSKKVSKLIRYPEVRSGWY